MTKKYNTRAAEPRHSTGVSLLQSAWSYVKSQAEKWGLTNNAALERIIMEHREGNKDDGYEDVLAAEEKKRRRASLIEELEGLVKEIKKMESSPSAPRDGDGAEAERSEGNE
jgi:hypothetical protein